MPNGYLTATFQPFRIAGVFELQWKRALLSLRTGKHSAREGAPNVGLEATAGSTGASSPGSSGTIPEEKRRAVGQSPFAKSPSTVSAPANRRRSTRIDFVVPIIISGRNASGQTYREATETTAVSAHGAALKTCNRILLGMQLMVENLWDGIAEKAICVRVVESDPGQAVHVIAIQLLHPRNIWGVKDPPADWQFPLGPTEQPQAAAPTPAGPGMAPHLAAAPGTNPAPTSPAPTNLDLEQRSSELLESVLALLRRQASGILRESLKDFEDRLKVLETEAEERMARHSGEALAGAEISLKQLRKEMLEQIRAQAEQAVVFAEDSIRERVGELFLPHSKTSHDLPPGKKAGPETEK